MYGAILAGQAFYSKLEDSFAFRVRSSRLFHAELLSSLSTCLGSWHCRLSTRRHRYEPWTEDELITLLTVSTTYSIFWYGLEELVKPQFHLQSPTSSEMTWHIRKAEWWRKVAHVLNRWTLSTRHMGSRCYHLLDFDVIVTILRSLVL